MRTIVHCLFALSLIVVSCKKEEKTGTQSHKGIYAIGWKVKASNDPFPLPVYWNEGKEIILGNEHTYAYGISINGSDVYITGQADEKPVFWKNGNMYFLPFSGVSGSTSSVSFHNGDTYFAGSDDAQNTIWKNGQFLSNYPATRIIKASSPIKAISTT